MGSVFVARDVDLHREVAIKELLPHLSRDPDFAARFRAEAENLARLSHPNITTLYSLGHEGESEYMVMELIRGHTLKEVMGRLHTLGQRESLAVIAQAASALAYAHRMGVIHRDIKPSNIMVTTDGLLKIMDFGISRVRGSQRQTRDGGIVGTLLYISPEQLRSAEGDERSDMYSLAVTLYEMLTGEAPFRADNEYELMRMHLETPAAPISTLLPAIDPQIDAALARALAKNPDDRFENVEDFARALGVAAAVQGDAVNILRQCHDRAFDAEATIVFHPPAGISGMRAAPSVARTVAGNPLTDGITATRVTSPHYADPPQPIAPTRHLPARHLPARHLPASHAGAAYSPTQSRRGRARVAIGLTLILALIGLGVGYLFLPETLREMVMGPWSTPTAKSDAVSTQAPTPVPMTPTSQQAADMPVIPQAPEPLRPMAQRPVDVAPPAPQGAQEPPSAPVLPPAPAPEPTAASPPAIVSPPIVAAPMVPSSPEPPRLPPAPAVAAPLVAPLPVIPPVAQRAPESVLAAQPNVAQPAPAPQTAVVQQATPPVPDLVPQASTQQALLRPPIVVSPPDAPRVAPPQVSAPTEAPAIEGVVSAAAGTHAIMIGGRFVTLFGIEPNSPSQAQFDQDRLVVEKLMRGMTAACFQRPQNRFKCTGRNGEDLAMLALKAGVVRPSQNAPPEYRGSR